MVVHLSNSQEAGKMEPNRNSAGHWALESSINAFCDGHFLSETPRMMVRLWESRGPSIKDPPKFYG
jgi:hypothetical protein